MLLGRVIFYTPRDVYLGQLGAGAEAIHCGMTTVLDHSHIQLSQGHIEQHIRATIEPGVRSVYCFAPYGLPESANPLRFPEKPLELHQKQLDMFYRLAEQSPLGNPANDAQGNAQAWLRWRRIPPC